MVRLEWPFIQQRFLNYSTLTAYLVVHQEIECLHYSWYTEIGLIVVLRREKPDMKYGNIVDGLSDQLRIYFLWLCSVIG